MMSLLRGPACPVCLSARTVLVRYLQGQRSRKRLRLYACWSCRSLFNPSPYREDDDALRADCGWHVENFTRNGELAAMVLAALRSHQPGARTLLDIGCGIGATVLQAQALGLDAVGVEPNRFAVEYAREHSGLDLVCDYFRPGLLDRRFDLITCCHVLEHLERPRPFLQAALDALNRPGLLYLSVPWRRASRELLKYLLRPDAADTPFMDNDVHVTHYSTRSLHRWATESGARAIHHTRAGGWSGYAFAFP